MQAGVTHIKEWLPLLWPTFLPNGFGVPANARDGGGRIAKDRIFTALRNEALAHGDRAAAIAQLLHDMTLSMTLRDKAPALMILRDIAHAWPDITLPVTVARAGPPCVMI